MKKIENEIAYGKFTGEEAIAFEMLKAQERRHKRTVILTVILAILVAILSGILFTDITITRTSETTETGGNFTQFNDNSSMNN